MLFEKYLGHQNLVKKYMDLIYEHSKFNAAIEKSLESLQPELRKTFINTFTYFPHAIYVPQKLIAAIWSAGRCEKDLDKLYRHGEICYKQLFVYAKLMHSDAVPANDIIQA